MQGLFCIFGSNTLDKLTATISLERAQWACLFLMISQAAPTVPGCLWDETDAIEKAISGALGSAYKGDIIDFDIEQAISQKRGK